MQNKLFFKTVKNRLRT